MVGQLARLACRVFRYQGARGTIALRPFQHISAITGHLAAAQRFRVRTVQYVIGHYGVQQKGPVGIPLLGIMRGRLACGPGGFVRLPVLIDLFPGLGLPQGIQGLAVIRRQGKRRECLQSHKSGEILLGRCHATARRPKMDFAFKGLVNTMVFNVTNGCMEFIA